MSTSSPPSSPGCNRAARRRLFSPQIFSLTTSTLVQRSPRVRYPGWSRYPLNSRRRRSRTLLRVEIRCAEVRQRHVGSLIDLNIPRRDRLSAILEGTESRLGGRGGFGMARRQGRITRRVRQCMGQTVGSLGPVFCTQEIPRTPKRSGGGCAAWTNGWPGSPCVHIRQVSE
jgi:hypothetical protein